MVHKIMITGKPAYLAGRLKLRNEYEGELRGWGGRTVEIPDYSLETSELCEQEPERRDVNLQVQGRSKEVGEGADTSETMEVTTKERKIKLLQFMVGGWLLGGIKKTISLYHN
jgi:hypothetical protein